MCFSLLLHVHWLQTGYLNNQHLYGSSFWDIQTSVCLPISMHAATNVYLFQYLCIVFYCTISILHIRFCICSESNLYYVCVRCIAVTDYKSFHQTTRKVIQLSILLPENHNSNRSKRSIWLPVSELSCSILILTFISRTIQDVQP